MIIEFPSLGRMRALVAARVPHVQALYEAAALASMNCAPNSDELLRAAHTAYGELSPAEREALHPTAEPKNVVPAILAGIAFGKEVVKLLKK